MKLTNSTASYMKWAGALKDQPEGTWEVIQDWHEHEFSFVTEDEIRVLFNAYTGERKIESRQKGTKS